MKKALMLVLVAWFALFSSSSFACDLCKEMKNRGFSPEIVGKGISEHFGGNLKADGPGKSFSFKNGSAFNLAADQNGRIFRVKGVENLRGLVFTGTINNNPVEIFISNAKADEIGFVGIKADTNLLSARQKPVAKPIRNVSLASRSFEVGPTSPERQTNFMPTLSRQTIAAIPVRQRVEPMEVTSTHIAADQIIEARMEDERTLMGPMDQQVQAAKEKASLTDQQVKQVTVKKKIRNQKYFDAGVTTAAIVSGLAIPPPFGPIAAGGIILGRVGWGLFQSDPNDE